MYLENKWCFVYAILYQSIVKQDNLIGVFLIACYEAELPAILDSFFTSITSDNVGVVGSHEVTLISKLKYC